MRGRVCHEPNRQIKGGWGTGRSRAPTFQGELRRAAVAPCPHLTAPGRQPLEGSGQSSALRPAPRHSVRASGAACGSKNIHTTAVAPRRATRDSTGHPDPGRSGALGRAFPQRRTSLVNPGQKTPKGATTNAGEAVSSAITGWGSLQALFTEHAGSSTRPSKRFFLFRGNPLHRYQPRPHSGPAMQGRVCHEPNRQIKGA